MIVSHDREFIDNTCNSVWAFEGEGKVTEIVGGFSDFEAYRAQRLEQQKALEKLDKEKQQASDNKKSANKNKSGKLSYKLKLELERCRVK